MTSVDYLLTMKERGHNIRVINASFGIERINDQDPDDSDLIELYDSILSDLNQQGILFIASSGNSGVDTSEPDKNHYPSNSPLENVISVGSIDRNGYIDSFGNFLGKFYGNYSKTKVDLVAPGVSIPALRTASIESTYAITNLFSNANILCDDLEPPPLTGSRDCDNPSADTSPRWTAENGWELTSDQSFNIDGHSWGTDIPSATDPDAILTHQPISLKGYMTQSSSVSIPAPIVLSFRYRAVTLPSTPITPPPLFITIDSRFLVNSQVEFRHRLFFFTDQPWAILANKIPDFLYEHDNVQLQFVVAKSTGIQVYIDNIAITTIQIEDAERTTRSVTGTSFSAPHVAGAAALLWSARPKLHHLEVRDLLLDNVDKRPELENYFVTGGSLNVANAISAIDEIILELSTNSIVIPETQYREFTAMLKQAPETSSPITVTIEQGIDNQTNPADLMIDPSELIFTAENWDDKQTIRVSSTANNTFQDLRNRLTFNVPAPDKTQQRYIDVLVTNTDTAELVGLNSLLVLDEGTSTTIDFQLHLSTNSTERFIVTFEEQSTVKYLSFDIPSQLSQDLNLAGNQFGSVTIASNNNNHLDNIETQIIIRVYLESNRNNILSEQIINVKIINTETLQILGLRDLTLDENASTILSVSLSVQPTETYTVRISSPRTSLTEQFDLNVSPTTLIFTEQTWSNPQAVRITAPADGRLADSSAVLTFRAYPNNELTNIQDEQTITILVPNTEPLRILGLHDLSLDENTSTILSISFSLQPDRAYTVTIISTQNAQTGQFDLNVTPTALIFDEQTWSSPQTIQITAPPDNRFANKIAVLTFRAYPNNELTNIRAEQTISIAVTNTETLQILGLRDLVLDENASAILSVSLSVQPTETYTVRISTPRTSLTEQFDLNVSPTTLIFTEQTWNNSQAVRITAPADGKLANSSAVLTFQAYPNNEPTNIRAEQTISIAVTNTETLQILGLPSNLTLNENSSTILSVSLSLQPDIAYTVTIISTQNAQTGQFDLNVTPTALIFDEQTWSSPQTIQITAPPDNRFANKIAVLTFRAYPNNELTNIRAEQTISIAVTNTETLQILGLPSDLTLNENSSTILSVSLSLQPLEEYIVVSTPNNIPALLITPTLSFDRQNWDNPQDLRITTRPAVNSQIIQTIDVTFLLYPKTSTMNIQDEKMVRVSIIGDDVLRFRIKIFLEGAQ